MRLSDAMAAAEFEWEVEIGERPPWSAILELQRMPRSDTSRLAVRLRDRRLAREARERSTDDRADEH